MCTVNEAFVVHNFTWLHNGIVRLRRREPYTTIDHKENVGKLIIHGIPSNEAGNYTCIAYTTNSSSPLQATIMVILEGKEAI